MPLLNRKYSQKDATCPLFWDSCQLLCGSTGMTKVQEVLHNKWCYNWVLSQLLRVTNRPEIVLLFCYLENVFSCPVSHKATILKKVTTHSAINIPDKCEAVGLVLSKRKSTFLAEQMTTTSEKNVSVKCVVSGWVITKSMLSCCLLTII